MRKEVKLFAEQMEIALQRNDHKGGWDNCSFEYLFTRLIEEVGEISQAARNGDPITKECADVANFAMMIADRFGNLKGEVC